RRSLPLSLLTAPASTEIYTLSLHDALPISGVVSAASGAAAVAYVTQALRLAQSQVLDAVVGAPHNEQAIHEAGIAFNGYPGLVADRKSTRLNSSHVKISYAVFCLKKKKRKK